MVEFAYNRRIYSTTSFSPFEMVYGFNPLTPLDLCPLPLLEISNKDEQQMVELVKSIHKKSKIANREEK